MSEKLKPCLCGSKARIEQMGRVYHIYCPVCGAHLTGEVFGRAGKRSAIEKWNRRTKKEPALASSRTK